MQNKYPSTKVNAKNNSPTIKVSIVASPKSGLNSLEVIEDIIMQGKVTMRSMDTKCSFALAGIILVLVIPKPTAIIINIDAVSYTHLDVYKRQVLSVSGPAKLFNKIKDNVLGSLILFAIFWGSIYCLYIGLNDPFLYFRF